MREFDAVDMSVIETARAMFYAQGIRLTEMKDIAGRVNIGRSTLYRRFKSKNVIAFYIANDILALLSRLTEDKISTLPNNMSGYERFDRYAHAYAETLLSHPTEVRFLDEFDQIFTDEYPEEVEDVSFVSSHTGRLNPLQKVFEAGLADGSMHFTETPEYMSWLFTNMTMGIAQRVLPREKHYIEEQGHGKEFITSAVDMFVKSVK